MKPPLVAHLDRRQDADQALLDPVLPAMAGMKGVSLQFPVGYSLKDFQYVADVMDAGHADPKMLISTVVALDDLPSTFERLRGPNSDTKVQVSPAGL